MFLKALMAVVSLCTLVNGQGRRWRPDLNRDRFIPHRPQAPQGDLPRTRDLDFDPSERRIQQWCERKDITDSRRCRCKIARWCSRRGGRNQGRGICQLTAGWNMDELHCPSRNTDGVPTAEPTPLQNRPPSGSRGDSCNIEINVGYGTPENLDLIRGVGSPEECCSKCDDLDTCRAWSYHNHEGTCELKASPSNRVITSAYTSGVKKISNGNGKRTRQNQRRGGRAKKCDRSKLRSLKGTINSVAQREKAQSDARRGFMHHPIPPKPRNPNAKRQITELSVNNPDDYFQGDVDLTDIQADEIAQILTGSGRKKRKVGQTIYKLWDSLPISYSFATNYPTRGREKIGEAIRIWEENTCLRFQEDGPNTDRIEFVNGAGCSSMVGKVGGTQEISIAVPGCDFTGIVCHEIGHSLGFFHEQARPDRDQHIDVNYNNINFLRWNNFVKGSQTEINTFGQPYDYGSVMHYDAYGFATNNNVPTIETKEVDFQDTIGQRRIPSFVDFAQVNGAYCANKCEALSCQHGGYANPNKCQKCKCPDGWGGDGCEDVAHLKNCGGEYEAYREISFVTTPNYPNKYPRDHECSYLFKTTPGSKVYVEFVDTFEFECKDTCEMSFAEVKTGPEWRKTGPRFCCSTPPTKQFESGGNELVVLMKGYGSSTYRGFKVKYWTNAQRRKPGGAVVPTPKPQTTPRPTTPRPLPTTRAGGGRPIPTGGGGINRPGCVCGEWGVWSDCSQECGGCGHKQRMRRCNKRDCYDTEKRKCNFEPCIGKSWLWANQEFHLLIDECCIGLFKGNNGDCGGIQNIFGELISSFLPSLSPKRIRGNQ